MFDESRIFRAREGITRDRANDTGTIYRGANRQGRPERLEAKRLFVERYPSIRRALARHDRLGVAILAYDEDREPLCEGWIEASIDRTRAAVFGRHSMCGLVVPSSEESISLRHLAILVRAISNSEVRIRVIDLHSEIGFADEAGRTLQAVASEGSFFLSVGRIRLAILVTGEEGEPPQDGELAYACIPERTFLEEREGPFERERRSRLPDGVPAVEGRTIVRSHHGALGASARLLGSGETPVARLTISGAGLTVTRELGERSLQRGILVGRYSRCDVRTGVDSESISRVHALVVRDGLGLLVIDAASTNGTWLAGREISTARVYDGDKVSLGAQGDLVLSFEAIGDRSGLGSSRLP